MLEELTLSMKIAESVQSGQAGIWLRTHEPEEALLSMVKLAEEFEPDWRLMVWDVIKGMQQPGAGESPEGTIKQKPSALAAVQAMVSYAEARHERAQNYAALPEDDSNWILVLRNGHREICNNNATAKDMLMAIQYLLSIGKAYKCHLIIFSFPGVELPLELQEQFWVIDHELPNPLERKEILTGLLTGSNCEIPEDIDELAKSCGGLTRNQVEGVASLSIMKHEAIVPSVIWGLKAETINKQGLLSLYGGNESFDSIGGLAGVKRFCKQALKPGKPAHVRARAILLLGVPGTGKSAFAKALGNEMNRATLGLDIGALMGGVVGLTEERTREAFRVADAMEPCQIFVDEIEKTLGGQGGEHDGGVSSRMFGTILTWLNDHTSDVFFICTANNVARLPPEFTRAERFDAIFFMDLPSRESKDSIWDIYTKFYGLDAQERPADDIWTGAEIRACCRLSALFEAPLVQTAKQVVPVMLTAGESIEKLRRWADNRCLDAETGMVYTVSGKKGKGQTVASPSVGTQQTRKVSRRVNSSK